MKPGPPGMRARKRCSMRVALDTNRYTDLCRGDDLVVKLWRQPMRYGCRLSSSENFERALRRRSEEARNEAVLRRFLLKPGVGILYAGEQTTHHYANVYRQLRKQGTPIPTNDMWIAALVLEHSLVLCARDAHFDALAQIVRI